MAFIQRLGQLRSPVSTYANLPLSGNVLGDVRLATDTGDAYTWMIEATSGLITNWKKVTTSSYNDLEGAPTASGLAIDDAVAVVTSLAINIALLAFQTLTGYGASIARMFDSVVAQCKESDGMDDPSPIEDESSENYVQQSDHVMPNKGDLDIYTKFLVHGDGIQGSTAFVDLLRRAITSYGAITDTTTKKFGTGSIKFDGTNDYVDLGLGDLINWECLDFWFYSNASGEQPIMGSTASTDPAPLDFDAGECITVKKNSANKIEVLLKKYTDIEEEPYRAWEDLTVTSASTVSSGAWHHIAIQVVDDYLEIWIDGVLDATSATAVAGYYEVANYAYNVYLGRIGSSYLNGYLDEIRYSNIVRYEDTFTPMTKAYNTATEPAPTPTIEDESSSAHTVVVNGNARMSGTNPLFGNASLYLDGIDSYLTLADSDDWKLTFDGDESYGSELVVNGNFDSNVDNWSIVPSWGTLVLDSNGYSGNCLKGLAVDSSYAWVCSSAITTEIGKTYEISAYYKAGQGVYIFPSSTVGGQQYGIGDMLTNTSWTNKTTRFVATSTTTYINLLGQTVGVGTYNLFDSVSVRKVTAALTDYTVDLWIDPLSLSDANAYIIGQDDAWKLTLDGTSNKYLKFSIVGGSYVIAPISLSLETWQHVAIVQYLGTIKIYVDGVLGGSIAGEAIENGTEALTIGADSNGDHLFEGFIEEVRISDNARWSAAFTTPDEAYESDANTKLLLPLNVQVVPNMVLQSVGYVSNYVPTSARVVIFEEDIDVMEQNVDLKVEVSRDGGTTFTTCLIAKDQEFGDGTLNLFSGSVDLQGQPNGELLVWKLTTQNNKDCRIRGVSLSWR